MNEDRIRKLIREEIEKAHTSALQQQQKTSESEGMQQQLTVQLSIPIPPDSVLVSRVELEELRKAELTGVYWSMRDLEDRVGRKQEWIKENILYPSRFRKILDVDNGGFVYYPKVKGQSWSFHAPKMADFLDKHFTKIFSGMVS